VRKCKIENWNLPSNIVSWFKSKGVQLELTTALRKSMFVNENLSHQSRKDKSNWSSPVMYRFSDAIH